MTTRPEFAQTTAIRNEYPARQVVGKSTNKTKERIAIKIQILGTGCPKCKKLVENAEAAAKAAGVDYEIEKITDINDIMKFGVMMTPGLAVDGEIKVVGKVPSAAEIEEMLK